MQDYRRQIRISCYYAQATISWYMEKTMKKSWLLFAALATLGTGAFASTPALATGFEGQTLIDLGRRDNPTSQSTIDKNDLVALGRRDSPPPSQPAATGNMFATTSLIDLGRRDGPTSGRRDGRSDTGSSS